MSKELDCFAKKLSALLPDLIRQFMRRQSHALARGRVTVPQMAIMQLLFSKKGCTMSEISKHLGVTMAAATGLADRLVAAKLVMRSEEPSDRRVVKISLTKEGDKTVRQVRRQMENVIKDVYGKLAEGERESYLRTVEKLLSIMKDEAHE